jgi:hypothetical protein
MYHCLGINDPSALVSKQRIVKLVVVFTVLPLGEKAEPCHLNP